MKESGRKVRMVGIFLWEEIFWAKKKIVSGLHRSEARVSSIGISTRCHPGVSARLYIGGCRPAGLASWRLGNPRLMLISKVQRRPWLRSSHI